MSALVFEARWHRIQRSREQGYEELNDFLGRYTSLGPMVRCGLLRRREEWSEFQRYHGYIPTDKGSEFLLYIPEKELILVRPGKGASLFLELKNDPAPKAVFKETYAEPTRLQFNAVDEMRLNAGRDIWRTQRADQLKEHLLKGYMDLRSFTVRTGLGDGQLMRSELAVPRSDKPHDHALPIALTKAGKQFITVLDPWELMLIKPGMELPLFEVLDPAASAYWCGLP